MDAFTANTVIDIANKMNEAKEVALETIGLVAEGYAKGACPTRTSRLKNSITHTRDEGAVYIGTNVEYAPYVEYGARGRDPVHFLRNAAADHTQEYRDILAEEIQKKLGP